MSSNIHFGVLKVSLYLFGTKYEKKNVANCKILRVLYRFLFTNTLTNLMAKYVRKRNLLFFLQNIMVHNI